MGKTFSYRRAIEKRCFLQLPLFVSDELTRKVEARALVDFLHPRFHRHALEEGTLLLRDAEGYRPWGENGLTPLYGHWQLLSLGDLDETLRGRSPTDMLAGRH